MSQLSILCCEYGTTKTDAYDKLKELEPKYKHAIWDGNELCFGEDDDIDHYLDLFNVIRELQSDNNVKHAQFRIECGVLGEYVTLIYEFCIPSFMIKFNDNTLSWGDNKDDLTYLWNTLTAIPSDNLLVTEAEIVNTKTKQRIIIRK